MAAVSARIIPSLARLENPEALGEAAAGFVTAPKSLVLDVSPAQPLTAAVFFAGMSHEDLIDALDITVSFNGGPPLPIKTDRSASPAPGAGGAPGPDDGDVDVFMDPDLFQ